MRTILALFLMWSAASAQPFTLQDQAFMCNAAPGLLRNNRHFEYLFNEGSGQWLNNNSLPSIQNVNLLVAPEQYFIDTAEFWAKRSYSGSDYYTLNPLGDQTATRVSCSAAADSYMNSNVGLNVTAQPYTFSMWAKSNAATNQNIRMWFIPPNTKTTNLLVGTNWTRISYTITLSLNTNGAAYFLNDSAGSATDISIWGAQFELGSSDTGYSPNFNARIGMYGNIDVKDPAWGSGYLDFSTGTKMAYGFPTRTATNTQFSVYALARVTTNGTANYQPIVGETQNYDTWSWGLYARNYATGFPGFDVSNRNHFAYAYAANASDTNWHALAGTYDGTTIRMYLDDTEVASKVDAGLSIKTRGAFLGYMNTLSFPGQIAYASAYGAYHSPEQVHANWLAIQRLARGKSITVSPVSRWVAFEGDSITEGSLGVAAASKYYYVALHAIAPTVQGRDYAASGSKLTNAFLRASSVDATYNPSRRVNILSVFLGANDLNATTAAAFVANLKTYCLARRAVGWKIIVCTVLPQTTAGFNTIRNSANTLIRADTSFYDALADFGADATIGGDATASNTTYYSDGVHPTAAGHAILAPIAQAAIQALLP